MNIFLVHHRSPHHATNSGYGRLLDYLDANVVYGSVKFPYRIAKMLATFHSQSKGNYYVGSVLKTLELYQLLKKHKKEKNIVHFLNGERDIRYLGFFKRKFPNTRFCATFHKPPEILEGSITNTAALKQLDGAIAVGENQVPFLKDWLQMEHVKYIPHGVDTEFFKPNASIKKQNTLLFVGQHLRDFDTFNKSVPKLAAALKELQINVVIHPAYIKKINPHSCIKIMSGVGDEQLLKLYQEATALYLPMLNSTACNSILEALACGLPIITSNVGGNPTYLKGTSNILVERGDATSFSNETEKLLSDATRLFQLGELSRRKARELDWAVIAKDIKEFYKI